MSSRLILPQTQGQPSLILVRKGAGTEGNGQLTQNRSGGFRVITRQRITNLSPEFIRVLHDAMTSAVGSRRKPQKIRDKFLTNGSFVDEMECAIVSHMFVPPNDTACWPNCLALPRRRNSINVAAYLHADCTRNEGSDRSDFPLWLDSPGSRTILPTVLSRSEHNMERRTFGNTSLEVSAISLGCWLFGVDWWGHYTDEAALLNCFNFSTRPGDHLFSG